MFTEKTLKSSLDSGSLLPIYLIAGEDIYLKRQALDRVIKATVEPDDEINLIKYEYGVSLQEVYDEINGFPLMADKKCVVFKDFDIEDADKTEFEKFEDVLTKTQSRIDSANKELDKLVGERTRQIRRKLKNVEAIDRSDLIEGE